MQVSIARTRRKRQKHLTLLRSRYREAATLEPRLLALSSWIRSARPAPDSREWRRRWHLTVLRLQTLALRNPALEPFELDLLNCIRVAFGVEPVFEEVEQ